ncbi:unnamed protein product, partial [Symbiodinium necroappetens]
MDLAFPHLNPAAGAEEIEAAAPADAAMPPAPTLGRRQREEQETELPDKFQRPAGKGQSAPTGKNPEASGPSQSSQGKEAGQSSRPNQPPSGRAKQNQQWTKKEWEDWNRQGYSQEKTNQELQKELEVLKEDVRLLARIAMRHEVQEATSSADSLENLAKLGYLRQVDGNPAWTYLQWSHEKGELEQMDKAPLPDQELR